MPNLALFALVLAAGALMPGAALGQGPMDLAMAGPQPHFVAAWAPEKEREAEHSAALARRVSLELQDVSLDAALKALTNRAGLRITYSQAILPKGKRVTIQAGDIAVVTALTEMLFRSGLDVVVDQDGTLALVRCKHRAPRAEVQDSGTVVGRVTDKATRAPIAGATVTVEGTVPSATTDADGRYQIADVPAGTYTVRVRYIGYAPLAASVTVSADAEAAADFGLVKSVQVLDEVVTTGSLLPTEVKTLPTPVTVITADDIALQRPRTVQEVFRQAVPGAVSWDNTARPSDTPFSTRGASTLAPGASQMKVFVDGVEHAFPTNTEVDPNSIERIEVIRGPQAAAIYGSDAIGGVIQIFTKRGDPSLDRPRVDAEAAAGVVQTPYAGNGGVLRQQYNGAVSGGSPDVTYHVGGGYSRTADYLPNGEQSAQSNPSLYGGMRFARGILAVDISSRYTVQNNPEVANPELGQAGSFFYSKPLYNPSQWANQMVGAQLSLLPVRWWRHTLTLGIDRFTLESAQSRPRLLTPDDTLLNVFNVSYTKRSIGYNMAVQRVWNSGISGSLMVGVDHYSLSEAVSAAFGTPSTTGFLGGSVLVAQLSPTNTGYFTQGQLGIHDRLFLTAGIRGERNSEFGDSLGTPLSPRAGVSYVQGIGGTTLKFRSAWGRAIRAPDPANKLSVGPTTLPNFELGPERQQGWDAGVDATFGTSVSLSATYYSQTAENLIQFVRVQDTPTPLDQFQNVGRVKNTGVELEGSLAFGLMHLKATYAYTRSRIEALAPNYTGTLQIGDQPLKTPKHTAGALLTANLRTGTTVTGGLTYIGRFTANDALAQARCEAGTGPCPPDNNFVVEFPSIVKLNATFWQQITPQFSAFASVYNLTNNDASESGNVLPVMGRVSMAGFRASY